MSPCDRSPDRRAVPALAPVLLVLLLLAVLGGISALAANAAGGSALVLRNAGAIARHGAPVLAMLADLAGCVSLGGAVVAGWLLDRRVDRERVGIAVAIAAGAWTLLQGAAVLTSYAVATGQPVGSPAFGSDLTVYLGTELGRWLLIALVLAAVTTVLAVATTGRAGARAVAIGAGLALFAKAMTGHAAGTASHETATSTLLVHLLGVGVWVGGLAALQLLRPGVRDDARVVRGYSRLALVCWVAILVSGVWALAVRMNGPGDLLHSAYVQLGVLKAVNLGVLGAAGLLQRRLLVQGREAGRIPEAGLYRRLALLELALMGLAIALAAAMSSSPPPASQDPIPSGPAELLTGYPLPSAPSIGALAGSWRPDAFALAAACALLLWWWWPTAPARPRAASARLLAGIASGLVILCGPLAVYAKVLFSAHLLEHALLLVTGALIGSALPRAPRALWGARWRPFAAAALAILVPAAAYAGPWLRLALSSHVAHLGLVLLCILAGAVLSLAARVRRSAGILGAVLLAGAGAGLAATPVLLAASWFGATGRPWLADALADQHRAGWALLVLALVGGAALAAGAARQERESAASNSARTVRRRPSRSARSTKGS